MKSVYVFNAMCVILIFYNADATELDLYILNRYKWLPGVSMTALEIFTGAYWDRNPHVSKN